jgi:hypothetical protein
MFYRVSSHRCIHPLTLTGMPGMETDETPAGTGRATYVPGTRYLQLATDCSRGAIHQHRALEIRRLAADDQRPCSLCVRRQQPQHALNAMLAALARCQDMVYDLADDKSNLPELQRRQRRETTEMIEHVCAFEAAAPKTVMHVQIHQLVHVAKCSYRWNRVRNFWAFANERSYYSFQLHLLTRNNPANCNHTYFQTRLL